MTCSLSTVLKSKPLKKYDETSLESFIHILHKHFRQRAFPSVLDPSTGGLVIEKYEMKNHEHVVV